jgi:hypothetical protein
MKTVNELFELIATATQENGVDYRTWFIDYSGHVNRLKIRYYFAGWKRNGEGQPESIDQELNEEGIQALYWFIKTRLK